MSLIILIAGDRDRSTIYVLENQFLKQTVIINMTSFNHNVLLQLRFECFLHLPKIIQSILLILINTFRSNEILKAKFLMLCLMQSGINQKVAFVTHTTRDKIELRKSKYSLAQNSRETLDCKFLKISPSISIN